MIYQGVDKPLFMCGCVAALKLDPFLQPLCPIGACHGCIPPPDVTQELARFAQVALSTTRQDGRRMACLCEAGKHVMEMEVTRLLAAAANSPCLMSYSADCT